MKMDHVAKGTVGDLVYVILVENAKLSDGKPPFHVDHNNTSAGVISVANLDKARKMIRLQKEEERPLSIHLAFTLVPIALETLANRTIKSASMRGADTDASIVNPIQNLVEVVTEPRLDARDTSA